MHRNPFSEVLFYTDNFSFRKGTCFYKILRLLPCVTKLYSSVLFSSVASG